MTFDVSDFQKQVLERSASIPVLVDFWAEWCGPCRVLGPVLERLANQHEGRWELAKLNTEEHPDIAQKYNIQSIPNVKLFVDGGVVDQFVGALPEYQIQAWLKKAVPGKNRAVIQQAEALLAAGNETAARKLLEQIPSSDPDASEANILLAHCLVFDQPTDAAKLVEHAEDPKRADVLEAIRTLARLKEISLHHEQLPDGDSRTLYVSALRAIFARDFDSALRQFIQLIRQDRTFDDDGSRKACIAIFKLLGEEHPITQRYRREFSSALY